MSEKEKQVRGAVISAMVLVKEHIPAYYQILRNYEKGYKPAKDFVKKVTNEVMNGNLKSNIDIINYLTNYPNTERVQYTYTKYHTN